MEFATRIADLGKKFDRELFIQWAFNTPNNLFDRKVMFYPTTNTILAGKVIGPPAHVYEPETSGALGDFCKQCGEPRGDAQHLPQIDPLVMIPFQATITIESIAARPGISPREMALALRKWHDGLENICKFHRIREIYFITADDQVAEFALGRGYTEINGVKLAEGAVPYECAPLAVWAKEHGYPYPIKRMLKFKMPGPEDKLPANAVCGEPVAA